PLTGHVVAELVARHVAGAFVHRIPDPELPALDGGGRLGAIHALAVLLGGGVGRIDVVWQGGLPGQRPLQLGHAVGALLAVFHGWTGQQEQHPLVGHRTPLWSRASDARPPAGQASGRPEALDSPPSGPTPTTDTAPGSSSSGSVRVAGRPEAAAGGTRPSF